MTPHNNKEVPHNSAKNTNSTSELDFNANDRIGKERGPLLKPSTSTFLKPESVLDLAQVITEAKPLTVDSEPVTLNDTILESPENDQPLTVNKEIQRVKELEDKLVRVYADAVNASKQAELDLANAKKNAKKGVVKDILPFLTALTLSLSFVPENPEAKKFVESLKSSANKLSADLNGHGIELIIPKIGDEFDPVIMQALNQPSSEDPKVINVASVGCKIDGQLIAPASVLI